MANVCFEISTSFNEMKFKNSIRWDHFPAPQWHCEVILFCFVWWPKVALWNPSGFLYYCLIFLKWPWRRREKPWSSVFAPPHHHRKNKQISVYSIECGWVDLCHGIFFYLKACTLDNLAYIPIFILSSLYENAYE